MSKELEYIQRHIDIVKQQIKGSRMKFTVIDSVTKHQYDYYENELQILESIEQALQRLEAIENTFADSHICEIQKEFAKYDKLCEETKCEECALGVGDGICLRKTFERKWELQKEVVSPNSVNLLMQELDCKDFVELRRYARCGYKKINKKYLKWEDLEFKEEEQTMKVKLNNKIYTMFYCSDEVCFDTVSIAGVFIDCCDKQFFNDLRLERVEE